MTYVNTYKNKFLEPFRELMRQEYTNINLYMDKEYQDRGASWFNLIPISESTEMMRSSGQLRNYEVLLTYYQHYRPERGRLWFNRMSDIGERIKRVIGDNSNFTVRATWVNQDGTWGATSITWSNVSDTYCWHNMYCELEYDPDIELPEGTEGLAMINFKLTFSIEEVYE